MATRKRVDGRRDGSRGGKGASVVLYMRVTPALIAKLDRRAKVLARETLRAVSRSDCAQAMIVKGLES